MPRRPANYVQRAGRAGRRTGNAFLVTFADRRRPREQYYFAEPRQMIAGEIVPPGCYLSAIEILRRQYVAHLADLAARGQLPGVLPMPRRASALFGESGWLRRLSPLLPATPDRRVRPARRRPSSPCSATASRRQAARTSSATFARTELKAKADEAEDTWNRRLARPARPPDGHRQARAGLLIETDPVQLALQAGTGRPSGAPSPGGSARSAAPTRTARSSTSACCRTTR